MEENLSSSASRDIWNRRKSERSVVLSGDILFNMNFG